MEFHGARGPPFNPLHTNDGSREGRGARINDLAEISAAGSGASRHKDAPKARGWDVANFLGKIRLAGTDFVSGRVGRSGWRIWVADAALGIFSFTREVGSV